MWIALQAIAGAMGAKAGRWAIIALASLVTLAGAYLWGRADGSSAATAKARAAAAAETARQHQANGTARAAADARTAELQTQLENLNEQIRQLDREAASDPRAADCGIGADSVRRLNSIK